VWTCTEKGELNKIEKEIEEKNKKRKKNAGRKEACFRAAPTHCYIRQHSLKASRNKRRKTPTVVDLVP
jgi:hypothetical protein